MASSQLQSPAPELAVVAADSSPRVQGLLASEIEVQRELGAGGARARDRLIAGASSSSGLRSEASREDFENLLLFIDDDLRETAMAIARVEGYLLSAHSMLGQPKVNPIDVQRLANEAEVLEHLDQLNETVESLRRRMGRLADNLSAPPEE